MKKRIVVLSLLVLSLMPSASSSRTEPGKAIPGVDKPQAQHLNTEFREIRRELSQMREDLTTLSSSMTAHESVQSHLIRLSSENIRSMEGICRYMETMTVRLSLVEEDRLSYYCNSQKYSAEQMKNRTNEYLNNIKEMRGEMLITAASPLIDEATQKILSSSSLIDEVAKMLNQCSSEEKPRSHH